MGILDHWLEDDGGISQSTLESAVTNSYNQAIDDAIEELQGAEYSDYVKKALLRLKK